MINTNAAARSKAAGFFANIETLARHADQLDMIIALENPGDGSDNLFNTAQDGIELLAKINDACVRLNYDAGNTISHRPVQRAGGDNPAADALLAMPFCAYTHIKDVRASDAGYFFTPLGQGDIECATILRAVSATPLNLSIEVPLRLHRSPDSKPERRAEPVPLAELEAAIGESLRFLERHLDQE